MKKLVFGEQNVKNAVNGFKGGQRGVCVVAFVSMDKKLDKAYKGIMDGRICKVVMWTDRPLISYGGSVNGKADSKFVPQAPKGFVWTQYPYFKQAIKSGVEYLTINFRGCDRNGYNEVYFLDGNVVEKKDIERYLKAETHYLSNTQLAVGVTDECEQTKVVQYELGNIAYVGTNKAIATEIFEECQK